MCGVCVWCECIFVFVRMCVVYVVNMYLVGGYIYVRRCGGCGCIFVCVCMCVVSGCIYEGRYVCVFPGTGKDQPSSSLPFMELGNDMFAVRVVCHLHQEKCL